MVAETASRRKGVAIEALNIFMAYAVKNLVSVLLQVPAVFLHPPLCTHCSGVTGDMSLLS